MFIVLYFGYLWVFFFLIINLIDCLILIGRLNIVSLCPLFGLIWFGLIWVGLI